MLPDRVEGRAGETYRGKGMSLTVVASDGLGPATRRVDVDPGEWDDRVRPLLQALHGLSRPTHRGWCVKAATVVAPNVLHLNV